MPESCALNFDHVTLVQCTRLGPIITVLPSARWPEIEQALLVACGSGSIESNHDRLPRIASILESASAVGAVCAWLSSVRPFEVL